MRNCVILLVMHALCVAGTGKVCLFMRRDILHGAREHDPKPRFQPSLCAGWLPAFDMLSPIESCQALLAIQHSRAVLLRRTPLVTTLASRWSLAYLVSPYPFPRCHLQCAALQKPRAVSQRLTSASAYRRPRLASAKCSRCSARTPCGTASLSVTNQRTTPVTVIMYGIPRRRSSK